MIAALDGVFVGENIDGAISLLGKPQPAVFHQVPALQWKQSSGLVITVIVKGGSVQLVNETAATTDDPTGIAEEDATVSGLMFNKDTHTTLALGAPSTPCKGSTIANCADYHYDRGIVLRAQFTPAGQGDPVLRDVTLADPSVMQQFRIGE